MRLQCGTWALAAGLLLLSGCGGGEEPSTGGGQSFADQVAEALRDTIPVRKARRLVEIGAKQQAAADLSGAERTWGQARLACEQVQEPASRAQVFALLAQNYAKAGRVPNAKRAIDAAKQAVDQIPTEELADLMQKVEATAELAKAYGAVDQRNDAVLSLRAAKELVDTIDEEDPDVAAARRSEVLNAVAVAYFNIDRKQDCQAVLDESLQLAEGIRKKRGRADAIAALAMAQHQVAPEAAAATFDRAVEAAREIEDELSRGHGLTEIAIKLQQAKRGGQAAKLLDEAEAVAEKVKDSGLRRGLMDKIYKARG